MIKYSDLFFLWIAIYSSFYENLFIFSSSMDGRSEDSRIFPISDLSGYYITGYSSTSAVICCYLFLVTTSSVWQTFSSVFLSTKGNLMLSSINFFFTGTSPSSPTPSPVRFYKYTFGNAVPDWTNKMICSAGTWTTGYSESQVSGSTIYNFLLLIRVIAYIWHLLMSQQGMWLVQDTNQASLLEMCMDLLW